MSYNKWWKWPFILVLWIVFGISNAYAEYNNSSELTPWTVESASEELVVGRVLLRYPPSLDRDAQALAHRIPGWWNQIEKTLAGDLDDHLIITYVTHPGRMVDATGVPHWAAGVARPSSGEIVISQHNPDGSPANLENLLRHEMAHVALYRAAQGAHLPQWFHEGIAESFASHLDSTYHQSFIRTILAATVPSIHHLDGAFTMSDQEVSAAYATSRDFVNFLRDRDLDGSRLRQLLGLLGQGHEFSAAFVAAYGKTVEELELEWRAGLWGRLRWEGLVDNGGLSWLFMVPLLVIAWWRRRRKLRAAWARIEQEEQPLILHPNLSIVMKNG